MIPTDDPLVTDWDAFVASFRPDTFRSGGTGNDPLRHALADAHALKLASEKLLARYAEARARVTELENGIDEAYRKRSALRGALLAEQIQGLPMDDVELELLGLMKEIMDLRFAEERRRAMAQNEELRARIAEARADLDAIKKEHGV